MEKDTALLLKNLNKTYRVSDKQFDSIRDKVLNIFRSNPKHEIKALNNLNIEIKKGECFGIIGHNGSGKSTLLNVIMGAIRPDNDSVVEVKGQIIKLSMSMGFDQNLSARENIYLNGSFLGMTMKQIGQNLEDIIDFADLEDFKDTKIKFFSKGMRARLAFAIALHAESDIYLFDEFFGGVGDINFRKKSKALFKRTFIEGKTVIIVSHSLSMIRQNCTRVMVLNQGEVVFTGKPKAAIAEYKKLMKTRSKKKKPSSIEEQLLAKTKNRKKK